MKKLDKAFELFDAYNRRDPNKINWDGNEYPAEYFYALQLYNWVKKLVPGASVALLTASRCQHIGRWKIPRNKYPLGKAGYLRWRSDLAKFHAATAEELLNGIGYDQTEINEVRHILLKQDLKNDEDVQVMENALCLVFLEFQFEEFIAKHDEEKLIRIVQKSWKKMSEPGRSAALTLNFTPNAKALLNRAVGG
ncbi:MAG: DUF4202 domain-containing protein [Chitinophagaceae bacterium]|nr:DUF4202 domain-containing protein [Chitinophagaceae bacterium]